MALDEYSKKRNFSDTPEPEAVYEKNKGRLRFVIQRHRASRLHYDLRLEMEGVLKSWAVPKGPSMNPADKRLAIMTEDHPIKYLTFHGTIPKGNYGAGEMSIWDEGIYEAAGGGKEADLLKMLKKGDLKITFFGTKIKGTFALVHTRRGGEKDNQWLLIKKSDEFSTDLDYDAEKLSEHAASEKVKQLKVTELIKPMLATKAPEIFNKANWIYELKWDGYRAIANIQQGKVDLYSRNGISFKAKFKEIYEQLKNIPHDVILDGEIVALDKEGKPEFQKLQNYQNDPSGELRYYVFDLLYLNGHNIMDQPLTERKSLLPQVIEDIPQVYYCDHVESMGKAFFEQAVEMGMEGVIAKKADSKYSPGTRSDKWLKIKAFESQEALICGFTDSETAGPFGSLILGMHKNEELVYIGNCGTGFSDKDKRDLMKKFKPLITDDKPFKKKINLKGRTATWLHPELICEVKFSEWTKSGHLRHPSFKGLRMDKVPQEITKEKMVKVPKQKPAAKKEGEFLEIGEIQVPISNLDKVYWPESGLRKYDLIEYYLQISETILPFLVDRPQNLHRHPNGINEEGFYQKDTAGIFPHWLETIKVHSKSGGKDIEYLMCQNEASLIYLANLGCIELNPWSSRKGNLENPDFTVIDIDPSEKTTFEQVIEVALVAKEVLDKAKIKGYIKTSGSSGMHIYIPLGGKYSYEEARDFTKILCYFIMEQLPEITSMERNVKKRKGKIYLDFLQNRKGQTLAAPYCARPKPGATVSAPLEWKEVKPGLDMREFNIKTMPARIEQKPDLFKPVLEKGIVIEDALEALSS
ncbi:bifunctional non-homologous end joining protein LigD [Salinimicrobium sediminis]|uniref:DNA ligase (ATP) n=1 Tax=Salinimicrobium sediminis TaxID=1343891 RepID=A0A285X580_9FLAO|nr:DNA ligase D [Salinimicrobium sediminis]SOC80472.1 bifunctional non-homologous end joining protein LigD [Salinimicrobium sediminis]